MSFDKAKFFAECRRTVMGPTLDQDEVTGAEAIITALDGLPLSWVAYALATAWHETAHTMLPCKERGGPAYFTRMYDIHGQRPAVARQLGNTQPGDGARFAGRGYVQLTGRTNYAKAGAKVGADLVADPDRAMEPEIAATILRVGMVDGWFTGRGFRSCLPDRGKATAGQFAAARRIINGTDKANLIAGYAIDFQRALEAGGWGSIAAPAKPARVAAAPAAAGWRSFLPGFLGGKA